MKEEKEAGNGQFLKNGRIKDRNRKRQERIIECDKETRDTVSFVIKEIVIKQIEGKICIERDKESQERDTEGKAYRDRGKDQYSSMCQRNKRKKRKGERVERETQKEKQTEIERTTI